MDERVLLTHLCEQSEHATDETVKLAVRAYRKAIAEGASEEAAIRIMLTLYRKLIDA